MAISIKELLSAASSFQSMSVTEICEKMIEVLHLEVPDGLQDALSEVLPDTAFSSGEDFLSWLEQNYELLEAKAEPFLKARFRAAGGDNDPKS